MYNNNFRADSDTNALLRRQLNSLISIVELTREYFSKFFVKFIGQVINEIFKLEINFKCSENLILDVGQPI